MSSRRYAAPLHLEPRPSVWLEHALILAHGLAVLSLALIEGHPPWIWPLSALIILGGVHLVRKHARLLHPASLVGLVWDAGGEWILRRRDGQEFKACLLGDSLLTARLVILNFSRSRWRRVSLVIPPDRLDKESFRRLRVRLRIEGGK
ncbi:MAG: hypothetical protein KDH88_01030 [Chromatiales bacterium]|nr:hypothetical protein [Chromatiales bacterium]